MSEPVEPPVDDSSSSTRPYLIRALYEWCTDNGLTPYIAVMVDETTQVPTEYVKNNEIVLNVSFNATSGLSLGNEVITFRARFGGQSREVVVPVDRVIAIYARETGQGMAFPLPATPPAATPAPAAPTGRPRLKPVGAPAPADDLPVQDDDGPPDDTGGAPSPGRRPALKRIK